MASNSHTTLLHSLPHGDVERDHGATSSERSHVSPISNSIELPQASRKRDLLLAFALVFVPLLVIVSILLAFVFCRSSRVQFSFYETAELPIRTPLRTSYYTMQSVGAFTLLGSWASNAASLLLAPFMILFSFNIARAIASSGIDKGDAEEVASTLEKNTLEKLIGGELAGLKHWISYFMHSRLGGETTQPRSRAVLIAGLGLLSAGLFSLLIVVGDNWLHLAVQPSTLTMYEDVTYPIKNHSPNPDEILYAAGWTTIPSCHSTLTTPLPSNVSEAPLPCSLNNTGVDDVINLAHASTDYYNLATAISPENNNNNLDLGLNSASERLPNIGNDTQILTLNQTGLSHSFLYYPDAAYEFDPQPSGNSNYGVDYVAHTTSMVTTCTSATKTCLSQSIPADQNILTIPFNCSADFHGDVGQPPTDGLERIQGWDTGFYNIVDGIPKNFPVQTQLNPFNFFAVSAVNSLSFEELNESGDPQATDGSIIDAGNGRLAFALDCEATIYDITYSLINGYIVVFNATPSTASKASIIKAPLQVSFGRYNLYQSALLAVIQGELAVPEFMSTAFSQVGMALASGVFTSELNVQQRIRYDLQVTEVPKAPLWFLITVCLFYTVISIVAFVAAMILRRNKEIARHYADLHPRYPIGIRALLKSFWRALLGGQFRSKEKKKKNWKGMKQEHEELDSHSRDDGMTSGDY